MAAMLRDSTVAAVVRTRPRTIPLPMTTMRKSVHGFTFPYMVMGLRLAALRAAGAPLLGRNFQAALTIPEKDWGNVRQSVLLPKI